MIPDLSGDPFGDKERTHQNASYLRTTKSRKRGVCMVKYVASTVLLVFLALAYGVAWADDTHTMTKEQLRPLLGKPDVIIIDVRTNYDWDNSKAKIPGAVREEGMKFASWMNKYPKDKTLVLYCA
jgi:hypothetical protein